MKTVEAELYNGSLPDDWIFTGLGELAEILMGQSPKGDTYNTNGGGVPLLNGPAEFGRKFPTAVQWTTAPTRIANPGDILFCVRGNTTGRMNIADRSYCVGRGLAAVRGKPGRAETSFVSFLLDFIKNRVYNVALGGGSTFPNISRSSLIEFEVPVPPLSEQQKIAGVLGLVQQAIEQQERLITLTTELKTALLHKLFTEGLRGEPEKQTEIGPVPESWETTTVGRVAQVKGGKRLPKGDKFADGPTQFPYIRVTDFSEFGVDMSDLKYLRPETHVRIKRYTISTNDIYISIAGSIGMTGIIPAELEGANLTENAAKLIMTTPTIDTRFLMYFLGSDRAQNEIRSQTVKNAQPKLALARIASLKLPIPAIEEQREIAAILDALGEKQRLTKQKKKSLEHLFRTLLHQLMTAQIRVHDLDLTEKGIRMVDEGTL